MSWMIAMGESSDPWPEPVQVALRNLRPTPAVFLSALLGFWAGMSARQHATFTNMDLDAALGPWKDMGDHATRFPMTPAEPRVSGFSMRGMWVLKFFERLGPLASEIESRLLACVEHADTIAGDAAVLALGGADTLTDEGYRRFLAVADARGRNGLLRDRARAIARHTVGARLSIVLDGVQPASPDGVQIARFAVLGALGGEAARDALAALTHRLHEPWPESGHASLLRALDTLVRTAGMGVDALLPAIRERAVHAHVEVRAAAAVFVARHAAEAEDDLLVALADDPHPWVREAVCSGLMSRPAVDARLLRTLCGNSLGNYDGYDGDPHDSVVALLLHDPVAAAQVVPAIVHWWNEATVAAWIERETTRQAMQLCDALAPHADVGALLPGFERALAYLDEGPATVELPGLDEPGAVSIVRNTLEADMLAAGAAPELAAPIADLHAEVLARFATQSGSMQAEIDAEQAIRDAEMRELYPEWAASEDAAGDADVDADEGLDEDEFIVELRVFVSRLRSGPGAVATG